MSRGRLALGAMALTVTVFGPTPGLAQVDGLRGPELLMHPQYERNQPVSPVFEGWTENPDGTHTLSFGFFNRNSAQAIEIPLGPNNFIEPAIYNGSQPTSFPIIRTGFVGRGTGVFGIVVPANFPPDQDVVWTLTSNGRTYSVPGRISNRENRLNGDDEAVGSGSLPPRVRFGNGSEGIGIRGVTSNQVLRTSVGTPVAVAVWAQDRFEAGRRQPAPVIIIWSKHQGPSNGTVAFVNPPGAAGVGGGGGGGRGGGAAAPAAGGAAGQGGGAPAGAAGGLAGRGGGAGGGAAPGLQAPAAGGEVTTMATFSAPGEYVLRVEARASARDSSNSDQCCWTNGFVRVTVSP